VGNETETAVERAKGPGEHRLTYAPGLDGLRAVALLAIIAFHVGFTWLPGGFYSVDTFFVLSGYLITSLLVVEWNGSGTIRLRQFWARRARRLLPALFVLVAGVALVHLAFPSMLAWQDPMPDAAATLGYVANWHFIAADAGYFVDNSPLLHTWTLAIEEQFYLVWPLVVLGVLCFSSRISRRAGRTPDRRRRLKALLAICMSGAAVSAFWMWHLTPSGYDNRAYYGTDARAQSLLVGASIAVALKLASSKLAQRPVLTRRCGAAFGVAGVLATALTWWLVPLGSALAFHGGFLLASLASGAIVAGAVLAPSGLSTRALAARPLRYLGTISYGAYLWYWPVYLVLLPHRLELGEWGFFFCIASATFSLAAISSKFIELPIRRGSISSWRAVVGAPAAAAVSLSLVAVSTVVAIPSISAAAALSSPQSVGPAVATKFQSGGTKPPPVRILLVGDSMAGTLGATLAPYASSYGIELINEGHPGCSVSTDSIYRFALYQQPPGPPCELGNPNALLDQWRTWVNEYKPNVVVYLARSDLFDQEFDGSWTSIGHAGFDGFLLSQLQKGIGVLGSEGAHVVLLTSPYYDSVYQGGGALPAEDTPSRVPLDDGFLREAASTTGRTTIFAFGQLVNPGSAYVQDVDGVSMRCTDGVHLSVDAGKVIAPTLLPFLTELGRKTDVVGPSSSVVIPPLIPSWYTKLQCGQQ
jgi:peptidoglycan/LPS O-acetylase OafA/YrhL